MPVCHTRPNSSPHTRLALYALPEVVHVVDDMQEVEVPEVDDMQEVEVPEVDDMQEVEVPEVDDVLG